MSFANYKKRKIDNSIALYSKLRRHKVNVIFLGLNKSFQKKNYRVIYEQP